MITYGNDPSVHSACTGNFICCGTSVLDYLMLLGLLMIWQRTRVKLR